MRRVSNSDLLSKVPGQVNRAIRRAGCGPAAADWCAAPGCGSQQVLPLRTQLPASSVHAVMPCVDNLQEAVPSPLGAQRKHWVERAGRGEAASTSAEATTSRARRILRVFFIVTPFHGEERTDPRPRAWCSKEARVPGPCIRKGQRRVAGFRARERDRCYPRRDVSGGQILMSCLEAAFPRAVRLRVPLTAAGVIALAALMIFANVKDAVRYWG